MASKVERLGRVPVLFGVAVWVLFATILSAQMPATADAVIEEMAGAAGVIFAGQVIALRGPTGFAGGGVVEVDFRVDQAVRGPAAGSVYTLREWAGLWSGSGGGRYRAGQRLLVLLYTPDANGVTSPVRGLTGAIPLRGGGTPPGPDDTTTAAAHWMVDLRWIQAQAARSESTLGVPGRVPLSPQSISPQPISPGPVSPRPISDLVAEDLVAEGKVAEDKVAEDRAGRETEPLGEMLRRLPVPSPPPAAPAEAQPLAQVIALCQRAIGQPAMRQTDEAR